MSRNRRVARLAREAVTLIDPPMTPREAWLEAAQWGSNMFPGDPGQCMYGFREDGRVRNEQHRQACLRYIDGGCHPQAPEDEELLRRLRAYLTVALTRRVNDTVLLVHADYGCVRCGEALRVGQPVRQQARYEFGELHSIEVGHATCCPEFDNEEVE